MTTGLSSWKKRLAFANFSQSSLMSKPLRAMCALQSFEPGSCCACLRSRIGPSKSELVEAASARPRLLTALSYVHQKAHCLRASAGVAGGGRPRLGLEHRPPELPLPRRKYHDWYAEHDAYLPLKADS